MKAIIQRGRIRVSPVPTMGGYRLWVWLKKPLNAGNKPYVYVDVEKGRKFYDLPCAVDEINSVVLERL